MPRVLARDYAENMQDFLIALLGDIFGKADRDTSAAGMTFAKKLQDNWQKIFYSLTIPGMIKNGTASGSSPATSWRRCRKTAS